MAAREHLELLQHSVLRFAVRVHRASRSPGSLGCHSILALWAAAEALDLPLSLHTATRRQGKIPGAGDKTLRDASLWQPAHRRQGGRG